MSAEPELCGCCEPLVLLTPLAVENRPSLSAVAYRIGTYGGFRESMLHDLPRDPDLAALTTRDDDDHAITVLDLWAAVADVLTFYQERYANEAFLRTATRPESVRRLVDLIGYRLAPGVAATTWLAFSVEDARTLALPAGLRVQSVPGQGTPPAGPEPEESLPQTFETLQELTADGRLNRLRIFPEPSGPGALASGQIEAILDRAEGPAIAERLAPGARVVLFFDGGTTPVEEKEVGEVRPRDDHVVLAWTRPVLGAGWTSAARAHAFTRTFRLFGHNAPATPITLSEDASSLSGVKWTQSTTDYAYPKTTSEISADPATGLLCLDGRQEGVAVGDRLLVADTKAGGRTTLVTVRAVEQVQDSLGEVTETVTRLRVAPPPPAVTDRRTVVVYRLTGPRIKLWDQRYPASLTSTEVHLPGRRSGDGVEVGREIEAGALTEGVVIRPLEVEVGRTVLLTDDSGTTLVATITAAPSIEPANAAEAAFCHLVLSLDVEGTPDLDTDTAVILGNVAKASHGETVRDEALGSGDASQTFQRFALRKNPLTYVPTAAGVASSLRVEVGGVDWAEAPSLYGRGPADRVLTTRIGDDGTVTVQFGDGVTGAVVPTGQANVTATYRVGTGLAGRVWAGSMTTALDRPQGLQSVKNPLAATGGADPETMDGARDNAPRTVRTFGRVVSLRDFADQATATGEVAKAHATWVWDGLDRAVFLTVAAQGGALFTSHDLERLGAALTVARDPNHRLMTANFTPVPVRFRATVTVDPEHDAGEVAETARDALLASWSFDALGLGQSLHLSDTYRVLHDVEGVVAVEVKELMFEQPSGTTATQFDLDLTRRAVARKPDGTPQPVQGHLRIFPAVPDPAAPGLVRPAELAFVESPTQDVQIDSAGGSGA